jgi:4,5-DOPA dioxygenase extradiol
MDRLFVSHGSPMLALDAGETGAAWRRIAQALPRPRAIVVVSAHCESAAVQIGAAARYLAVHDFRGFPAALYEMRYAPPGAPALARTLVQGLQAAGWPAELNADDGLDHGAWVPLMKMYPEADVPVVPVSIDVRRGPGYHHALGAALGPLLAPDVLLLASGSLTHNLFEFRPGRSAAPAADYVTEFQDWFQRRLAAHDLPALLDYRRQAPAAVRAHPSEEHLLPLYVALGAAGPAPRVERHFGGVTEGILAMDVYGFTPA